MYLNLMAWREILSRIFEGFTDQQDASPEWLVNPATRRRLKLDFYYPEIGVAIRFVGVKARGQKRQSDWDLLEEEQRDQTRAELCRLNGVALVLVDIDGHQESPRQVLDRLHSALSRGSRNLAQSRDRTQEEKQRLMPMLAEARTRLGGIRERIKQPEDMAVFAERWRDRETDLIKESQQPLNEQPRPRRRRRRQQYERGMKVQHSVFGDGEVMRVERNGEDMYVTVKFDNAGERTFVASLVADKLSAA